MPDASDDFEDQKRAEAEVARIAGNLGPFVVAAETTRMAMVFANAKEPGHPIIFANDSFLVLTGYDREEVLGQNFNFLLAHVADHDALAKVKAEFEGSSECGAEINYRRKDGTKFWAGLFVNPVRDDDGNILQYFASFTDSTKHFESEALSNTTETILIEWTIETTADRSGLILLWEEKNGPKIAMPSHKGFVIRMIERGVSYELDGSAHLEFPQSGLKCTIKSPLSKVGGDEKITG